MKDQNRLLKQCLNNGIPAIVFQGTDSCSLEILKAAEEIYRKHGCSEEFLCDFQLLWKDFKAYQLENSSNIKVPELNAQEKELIRADMNNPKVVSPEIEEFQQVLNNAGFKPIISETVTSGNYILDNNSEYCNIIGKNGDYEFAISHNKDTGQSSFHIFSNDTKYPERIGEYTDFKYCFTDIMYNHPLTQTSEITLKTISESYQQRGYDTISNAIDKYKTNFENVSKCGSTNYTIEEIEICSSGNKAIYGDVTIFQKNNSPKIEIVNLRIQDKFTGKTEPLNTDNIDLFSQPADSLKKILSGGKAEMKISTGAGINNLISLNKKPLGWGLQIGKQVFNTADSSAEV